MTVKLFASIVWEAFQWIAVLGGVLGLIVGLLLVFRSATVFSLGERLNVWISTRQAMRPLEEPITVERTIYRHHRFFGILILAGALYTLYVLVLRFQSAEIVSILARLLQLRLAPWLAESLRIFFIVMNVVAVALALVMIIRPSALKGIEEWANRGYSGRRAMKVWEIPRGGADRLVREHPRLTGIALSLAGVYILMALALAHLMAR